MTSGAMPSESKFIRHLLLSTQIIYHGKYKSAIENLTQPPNGSLPILDPASLIIEHININEPLLFLDEHGLLLRCFLCTLPVKFANT